MVVSTRKCLICEEQNAKYKCSNCSVDYCSVECFRTHRDTSSKSSCSTTSTVSQVVTKDDSDQDKAGSLNSDIKALLVEYPELRSQLLAIYNTTSSTPDSTYRPEDEVIGAKSNQHKNMVPDRASRAEYSTKSALMLIRELRESGLDGYEKLSELAAQANKTHSSGK